MTEPCFSGIDPLRLPEVRRRIAALNRYLALPEPNTADAVRFGKSIGLSRWQFQRLAAVWRNHRDPRLVFNGRHGRSKRDYGIAPRATEIAEEVIAQARENDTVTAISIEIEARCAAESVAPPSRPTIWSYVRKARAEAPASGPPRVVIGRMWFHLPIKGKAPEAMPMLLAAVLLPEGKVVAYRISTDPLVPPPVAELVAELAAARTGRAPARKLRIDADDRRAADRALVEAGLNSVRADGRSVQKDLSRSLGGRLGPLVALYRRSRARPATRKPSTRLEQPLESADVVSAVEDAIATYNASSPSPMPEFDIATS